MTRVKFMTANFRIHESFAKAIDTYYTTDCRTPHGMHVGAMALSEIEAWCYALGLPFARAKAMFNKACEAVG